jgi:hypothetical protein
MGYSAQLHHAYRFESEKLLNPENYVGPFYMVKTDNDISKMVVFLGAILNKTHVCTVSWKST